MVSTAMGGRNKQTVGNELADKKAKEATNYTNIDLVTHFSKTEIRDIVKKIIFKKLANIVGRKRKERWYERIQTKLGK